MLGSKSIIILQILYNTDEEKNLKELAKILNFSERSLRYEIEKIFETLDVKELELKLSKGSLKIGNKKKLLEILEKNYKSSNFSSEEREIYITLKSVTVIGVLIL